MEKASSIFPFFERLKKKKCRNHFYQFAQEIDAQINQKMGIGQELIEAMMKI